MNNADSSLISRRVTAKTLNELGDFALEWTASELRESLPKLVFLRGEMGAGKTSFVAKVASALEADDAASPSFALHSRYEGRLGTIDHFDLDRLNSKDDLESMGFWDLMEEAGQKSPDAVSRFVMIEWPKRLDEFGVGTEDAAWTKRFRSWVLSFEGSPNWQILLRRLS